MTEQTPNTIDIVETSFRKKGGELRTIRFLCMDQLDSDFKGAHINGKGTRQLAENYRVVWDVENEAFRTINVDTIDCQPHFRTVGAAAYLRNYNKYEYTFFEDKAHNE